MHETTGASSLTRKTAYISEDLRTITPEAIKARLWSIPDTAVILGRLSRRQVDRLIAIGDLETRCIGTRRVVVGTALAEYMANLPTQPQEIE